MTKLHIVSTITKRVCLPSARVLLSFFVLIPSLDAPPPAALPAAQVSSTRP